MYCDGVQLAFVSRSPIDSMYCGSHDAQTSKLLDELLGQFHDLQSQVDKIDESGSQLSRHLSGELSATQAKLKELEDLKPAAESIDDALITDLQAKMKDLQADIDKIKVCVGM